MSSGQDSWYDSLKDEAHIEVHEKAKEQGIPFTLHIVLKDLEELIRNNRSEYSYSFGLRVNAIMNQIKEYL